MRERIFGTTAKWHKHNIDLPALILNMKLCGFCRKPLPVFQTVHFTKRDPSIQFCSRRCFYSFYLLQGPQTPFDATQIWPLLHILAFPFERLIDFLCCVDEIMQLHLFFEGMLFYPTAFDHALQKYQLEQVQPEIIVLLALLHDRIISMGSK